MCDATDQVTYKSHLNHGGITEGKMTELIVIFAGALLSMLLAATTYTAVEYYKQLRGAKSEYEKAKGVVEDIVLSFNRELKREAERLEKVAYKVELSTSKAEAGLNKVDSIERRMNPLESQFAKVSVQVESIKKAANVFSEATEKLEEKQFKINLGDVDERVRNLDSSQELMKAKLSSLEEQMEKLSATPEFKTDTILPVMPIKRDKALSVLTETEISVLEFLSTEGSKTAPEIKEKVKLSREHTARLMKRLYEEGYLERETSKLPFKYSVKKEVLPLLKGP